MSSTTKIRRIVVALSGGVDSAVAAALLQKRYGPHAVELIGVHMQNWDEQDESGQCRKVRDQDAQDARDAADLLRIPFTTVSFVKEYWNDVFSTLLSDYERGFTPNPDILCNRYLKFGSFFNYAKQTLGADCIATGHYAQIDDDHDLTEMGGRRGQVRLLRALDATKDQTLFLSGIPQEALRATLFPLGDMYKSQVRRLAKHFGMETLAKKRDSVGICFIGNRSFTEFISEYIPHRPGAFIDLRTGHVIRSHNGVHHYTIGQRCRISGGKHPWFVAARDPTSQTIYAVDDHDHPALYSSVFLAEEPHWICDVPTLREGKPFLCMFKFQHTEWTTPALLYKVPPSSSSSSTIALKVWLSIPTRAVTPGQVAVFYKGNVCLGSAKILWVDVLSQIGVSPPFPLDQDLLCLPPQDPAHSSQEYEYENSIKIPPQRQIL